MRVKSVTVTLGEALDAIEKNGLPKYYRIYWMRTTKELIELLETFPDMPIFVKGDKTPGNFVVDFWPYPDTGLGYIILRGIDQIRPEDKDSDGRDITWEP